MKITLEISDETYHETLKHTGAKTFPEAALIAVREYIRYIEEQKRLKKGKAKKAKPGIIRGRHVD